MLGLYLLCSGTVNSVIHSVPAFQHTFLSTRVSVEGHTQWIDGSTGESDPMTQRMHLDAATTDVCAP